MADTWMACRPHTQGQVAASAAAGPLGLTFGRRLLRSIMGSCAHGARQASPSHMTSHCSHTPQFWLKKTSLWGALRRGCTKRLAADAERSPT